MPVYSFALRSVWLESPPSIGNISIVPRYVDTRVFFLNMVKKCCVFGCRSECYKDSGVSFFQFPKCEQLRQLWINAVPGKISKNSVVCHLHFRKEDISTESARPKYKLNAVPSIFHNAPRGSHENFSYDDYVEDENDEEGLCRVIHKDETPKRAQVPERVQLTHEQIHCDHCDREIKGFRYKCLQCEDFDLCQACEAAGMHFNHYMIRIPNPRPELELSAVLHIVRTQLEDLLPPMLDEDSEQTVPVVSNKAGPSGQKKSETKATSRATKPAKVSNNSTNTASEPKLSNTGTGSQNNLLNDPMKTEMEPEMPVNDAIKTEYDPLNTEPNVFSNIKLVVQNTDSVPLSSVSRIIPKAPYLEIDPTSLNISTVSDIVKSESDDESTVFTHTVYEGNIVIDSSRLKPPANKRLKHS